MDSSVYYCTASDILLRNRRCPAAHLAEKTIRLNIARVLATFHIHPPLDEEGNEYMPKVVWNKDVIRHVFRFIGLGHCCLLTVVPTIYSHPAGFDCRIVPRSDTIIGLLRQGLYDVDM